MTHEEAIKAITENKHYNCSVLIEDMSSEFYQMFHEALVKFASEDGLTREEAAKLGWRLLYEADAYASKFDIYDGPRGE